MLNQAVAAKANEDDDKPRVPPPPPTPLDFPCCKPAAKAPDEADPDLDILKLFSNILRTGPSRKHLEALNIGLENNLRVEEVVPSDYLPPKSWVDDPAKFNSAISPSQESDQKEKLSNGGPLPGHEQFYTRVRELTHDNEDAFRATRQKKPRPGTGQTRVLHFRKFWDGLLMMSEYWDTSQDKYSKAPSDGKGKDGSQNAQESGNDKSASAMDVDDLASIAKGATPPATYDDSEETYTGRRKDTGRNMPPKFREETIFSFVEPLAWCFRCRLEHARMQPRVKISGMLLPVPHNGNVYRTPEDPKLARRGILEGPVAGVFCRDQVTFRRPEDALGEGKQETLDLLREAGLCLMLAQKRAREGTQEENPGEDQWWTNKPRWGGGKGGEMGLSEEETVVTADEGSGNANAQGQPPPGKRPRRLNRAAGWKELKPPATTWERGITYMRIGSAQESSHDDVYLFSALNHHISIVHLRVAHRYMKHLGARPTKKKTSANQQPWYRLDIRRTRWFDLFVAEDRVKAMRGIWAVLGYLMRAEEDSQSVEQGPS